MILGDTYVANDGSERIAPRDGKLLHMSRAQYLGPWGLNDGLPSGGLPADIQSALANSVDGYTFFSNELFQLVYGEGAPEGVVLVQEGEPFKAAILHEDVTFAFQREGDSRIEAGNIAFVNPDDVDGITAHPAASFFTAYVPLV